MKHGWEYKKLGEVASYINGFAFKPEQWTVGGVPIIRIQNLNNPDASFNHFDGVVPEKVKVANGDLLISWSATLGTYIWEGGDAYLNQHIFKVEFDKGDIDKMYLKYAVSSKLDAMANLVHGATMKHIVKKDFDNTRIPVPPLPVQKQICSLLDKMNRVIEAKKEQLKELDNLAQAIFYDMFGDPISNKKNWGYCTLAELITDSVILYHLDGNHGGDYPRSEEFVGAGVPYIGANAIINGNVDFSMAKYLTLERAKQLRKGIAQNNDVLFAHNATVGPVAILKTNEEKVILSTSLTAYRCNEDKMLPYFLKAYMKSEWFVCQYKKVMKQATRNQVPITKQKEMLFILPPLPLQQAFAEKVEAIERQKELINQSLREVQTLFDSRMDYWFSEEDDDFGQLDKLD